MWQRRRAVPDSVRRRRVVPRTSQFLHRRLPWWIAVTLGALGVARGADLAFELRVLDKSYIAYERDLGDIDRDGHIDMVAVQEGQKTLRWFRAPAWHRATLVTFSGPFPFPRADDLKLADLDGDGDLDVVTRLGPGPASDDPGIVVWCENLNRGARFAQHRIGRSPAYVKDIVVADFDRDHRPDLALRMDGGTQIWMQESGGRWTEVMLSHPSHEGLEVGDLDKDGHPDLVLNGFWFRTPSSPAKAREAANYHRETIDTAWCRQDGDWTANSCKVVVGDFDKDGWPDVALSQSERPGYAVTWYRSENPRARGPWKKHPVAVVDYCHTLQAVDWNLDGHTDLLVGGMTQSRHRGLRILLNPGTATPWTSFVIQTNGSYSAECGDVDGDGDIDIVGIRDWNAAPTYLYRNRVRDPRASPKTMRR